MPRHHQRTRVSAQEFGTQVDWMKRERKKPGDFEKEKRKPAAQFGSGWGRDQSKFRPHCDQSKITFHYPVQSLGPCQPMATPFASVFVLWYQ
jgi:hypothetical protein